MTVNLNKVEVVDEVEEVILEAYDEKRHTKKTSRPQRVKQLILNQSNTISFPSLNVDLGSAIKTP